ncbi:unnamed protein product [Lactuca saligna]|uniref:non-specific serine/threonine protein kinase n=1 Tax=Lactuca saligna TaxID=75948 RepID=A0AA36EK35_LACSI|nr:unnamed protein product [Lactuca saligna]
MLQGRNLEHLKIPLIDIVSATENFAKTYIIGTGSYGEVYKAELDHFDNENVLLSEHNNKEGIPKKHSTVAIKRILKREDMQGEEGFLREIEMLTSCKHPNIVTLLGFCDEDGHMILVYEHAFNGSLDDYLGRTGNLNNLTWVQRIKICIDIACGLNYLHTEIEDERRIIHRDIKSGNILLGENWEAKIADFGLSKFRPESRQLNTLYTQTIAGTQVYLDPEYDYTGKLKNETDIYSFGVVLFEIMSGRLANDPIYTKENSNGIAPVARRRFSEGTMKEMVDSRLMEETHDTIFTLNRGPDQDSLDIFSKIAYQCVATTQAERPTVEVIIKKLEEALSSQEHPKDNLKFSLEDIELATGNFSDNNLIGRGGHAEVYRGDVTQGNVRKTIAARRYGKSNGDEGERRFLMELQILLEYKHENIIGLVGYCNEMDEKIIVYEYAPRGSLDMHLNDLDLTWMKRLEICIDIASGLDFLHGGAGTQEVVMHRDIKSFNILLNDDWKAKISDFGISSTSPINKDMDFVINNAYGTLGYIDPLYMDLGFLTEESDIYSLGVVLYEIVSGRLIFEYINDELQILTDLYKRRYEEGNFDEMVFDGIKEQIAPKSLTTFLKMTYECLNDEREKRPTTGEVLLRLKQALEIQEDYEIWEPKLPNDYEEVLKMSIFCDIYSTNKKKDLYNMLSKGILLQEGKVMFSLAENGERNVMISAKKISYINRCLHRWRSVPKSRFKVVAEMLDILNLKMKIKTKSTIYVEGIEFRAIDNVKHEEIKESKEVQHVLKPDSNMDLMQQLPTNPEEIFKRSENDDNCEKLFLLNEVNGKKHLMLSANAVVYNSSDVKLFKTKPSIQTRFAEVIELLPQQVFRINCTIKSQMLSQDTEYACYLVYKLSEKCHGLHCPVKVRDLLHRNNKEVGIVYFRSPSPWNLHESNHAPEQRADGLMEVKIWKFNLNHEVTKNDRFRVNLKLISYEGTLSGFIVCGLEFRPNVMCEVVC